MSWLALSVSPWELIARATIVFWALFLLFRFVLQRDAGAGIGMGDFLFVVIVGDAAQNAMTGESYGVADGMVVIATLAAWNIAMDAAAYRFKWFERFTTPPRRSLLRNGRLNRRNMRREFITEDELRTKLHEAGLTSFEEVKQIFLESDGEIAVIKNT
jgi:uncharacterized membrane protein YcaP (DUF421 family)